MKKKLNRIILAAILIAVSVYFLFFTAAGSRLDFDETHFSLSFPDGSRYSVAYNEIVSLELLDAPDYGSAIDSRNEKGCTFGLWESTSLGLYTRCTLNKIPSAILLRDTDGSALVFNYQSDSNTRTVFQGFLELLEEKDVILFS